MRAWRFGFAMAAGLCLPLCPLMQRALWEGAAFLQRLTFQGVISLSQRVIELTTLLLTLLGPLIVACVLGWAAGNVARRLAGASTSPETTSPTTTSPETSAAPPARRWRLSVRELFVGIAGACVLLAAVFGSTRNWNRSETQAQLAFLKRFEASFTSGEVRLLAAPRVEEYQGVLIAGATASFRPLDTDDYRVVAPIEKDGKQRWAVWSYLCSQDFIYQYAYADAEHEDQLPRSPFPARSYIEGTYRMIDGAPTTVGPSAKVVSAPSPAPVNQPLTLTATAPPGTTCELLVFPRDAVTTELAPQQPDAKGMVRWSWSVDSRFAGYAINYELRCKQQRGPSQMVSTTRGVYQISAAE